MISKKEALKYAHEETGLWREHTFITKDGRILVERVFKTLCGYWFSDRNTPALWRFNYSDGRPTCPACVENAPYGYPGMLLVIRGALGIPQIVKVEYDRWIGIFGFSQGREIYPQGKFVLHVCQDGDVFEDIGMVVKRKGNELVFGSIK